MIDLSKNAKECRVAWLVMVDDKELYLTRSGSGIKYLGEKYKKVSPAPAMISKELADKLVDAVIYVGDVTKINKPTQLKLI